MFSYTYTYFTHTIRRLYNTTKIIARNKHDSSSLDYLLTN